LENWTTGGALSEGTEGKLRATLHEVVSAYIDWEQLGVLRADFVSARTEADSSLAEFRTRTFNFRRGGQILKAPINVLLPYVDNDAGYRSTVIALNTLREIQLNPPTTEATTAPPQALDGIATLAEELESWGGAVRRQLDAIINGDEIRAGLRAQAAELQILGAGLAGTNVDAGEEINVNAAFAYGHSNSANQAASWSELQEFFAERRTTLVELCRRLFSVQKGESVRAGFIDPSPLLAAWKRLQSRPEPTRGPHQSANAFRMLEELASRSQAKLVNASRDELLRQRTEADVLLREVSAGSSQETLAAATALRIAVASAGLGASQETEADLDRALLVVDEATLDRGIEAAHRISKTDMPNAFWILGDVTVAALHRSSVFATAFRRYLNEVSNRVQREALEDAQSPESVSSLVNQTLRDLHFIGANLGAPD
jgi:hypothetical protein